jgi:hypothetical protein
MLEQDPNWDKSIFDSPMLLRWIDGSDIVDKDYDVDSGE